MLTSNVLDLRGRSGWDPAELLVSDFLWPVDDRLVSLRELSMSVSPNAVAKYGTAVITRASLDPVRGGVRRRSRRYQGPAFQVGSSLRIGDLLVPPSPTTPVLLVDERLTGALIAAHFRAVRPLAGLSPLWLWGVLNSQTGRAARAAITAGVTVPGLASWALAALEVPVPAVSTQIALAPIIAQIERTTHVEEEEAPRTWWRVGDLRGKDWYLETSVGNPDLVDGIDLASICSEIIRGRNVRQLRSEQQEQGLVPVTDISVLGGGAVTRWVPDDARQLTIARPGDVFLAAVGDRPHAVVATDRTAVDDNVYLLRLHQPERAAALARFLNSTEGYRRRSLFLTRGGAPSFAKRDLERLPIPEAAFTSAPEQLADQPAPLTEQLERVLWQR